MTRRMLIDASHPEETRVVVIDGNRLEDFDFEIASKAQLKGNIYLAKVTRVEPSLQACFIDYGGNRHGFLAFSEVHPDYYRIPMSDREALMAAEAAAEREAAAREEQNGDAAGEGDPDQPEPAPSRGRRRSRSVRARRGRGASRTDNGGGEAGQGNGDGAVEPDAAGSVDEAGPPGRSLAEATGVIEMRAESWPAPAAVAEASIVPGPHEMPGDPAIEAAAAGSALGEGAEFEPVLREDDARDEDPRLAVTDEARPEAAEPVDPTGRAGLLLEPWVAEAVRDAGAAHGHEPADGTLAATLEAVESLEGIGPEGAFEETPGAATARAFLLEPDAFLDDADLDDADLDDADLEDADLDDERDRRPAWPDEEPSDEDWDEPETGRHRQHAPEDEDERLGADQGRDHEAGDTPAEDDGDRYSDAVSEARGGEPEDELRNRERERSREPIEEVGGDEAEEAARARPLRPRRHYKVQEVIKRRQIMLVQVTKEERGTKGAALTTYLSLAGRYCVLMPNTPRGGGISRKVTNPKERKRMKDILDGLNIPEGMAVILRTAGIERTKTEIKRDLDYLLRLWDLIRETTLQSTAPCPIHEEANLIKRAIRDLYVKEIDEILVAGEEGYRTAKDFMRMLMPSHAKKVKLYKDETVPLFHRFQVESQIDAMHSPTVQLRSGGYIVLNPTEALVAIDVNSGKSTRERHIEETAFRTNLEAADEIARQLRLRDLAGLIVVDFIDMEDNRHNAAVERRLKEGMKTDRARIQLGRISPFGLLELSRQRLRPSLTETHFEHCPHCGGTGSIRSIGSSALHLLRVLEEEGLRQRSAEVMVRLPTTVAFYVLNQMRQRLAEVENRYGFRVIIERDDLLIPPQMQMERLRARTEADGPALIEAPKPMSEAVIEIEEEADEAEDEAGTGAEAEGRDADRADGEDKGRSKRRRPRKGRRRPAEEARAAPGDGKAEPSAAEAEAAGGSEAASEGEAEIGEDGETEAERKRRRRGRRGGRRRTAAKRAEGAESAAEAEAEAEAGDNETGAPVDEPVGLEPAAADPEDERADRREPVEEAANRPAPEDEAARVREVPIEDRERPELGAGSPAAVDAFLDAPGEEAGGIIVERDEPAEEDYPMSGSERLERASETGSAGDEKPARRRRKPRRAAAEAPLEERDADSITGGPELMSEATADPLQAMTGEHRTEPAEPPPEPNAAAAPSGAEGDGPSRPADVEAASEPPEPSVTEDEGRASRDEREPGATTPQAVEEDDEPAPPLAAGAALPEREPSSTRPPSEYETVNQPPEKPRRGWWQRLLDSGG